MFWVVFFFSPNAFYKVLQQQRILIPSTLQMPADVVDYQQQARILHLQVGCCCCCFCCFIFLGAFFDSGCCITVALMPKQSLTSNVTSSGSLCSHSEMLTVWGCDSICVGCKNWSHSGAGHLCVHCVIVFADETSPSRYLKMTAHKMESLLILVQVASKRCLQVSGLSRPTMRLLILVT